MGIFSLHLPQRISSAIITCDVHSYQPGFRVGFRVCGVGFRVQGLWFRFRVEGIKFRT